MTDPFGALLDSLGTLFGLTLKADMHNACAIQIKKGLVIQLQTDETMEKVLIIAKVVEVNAGRFREEVLKEALKANGQPGISVGTFAYLAKTSHLILFQRYPIDLLNAETLAKLIIPFIDLTEQWKIAIENGKSCPMQSLNPTSLGTFLR